MKKTYLISSLAAMACLLSPIYAMAGAWSSYGAVVTPADSDELLVLQGGVVKRETRAQVLEGIASENIPYVQAGANAVESDVRTKLRSIKSLNDWDNDLSNAIADIGATPIHLICEDVITLPDGETDTLTDDYVFIVRPGCLVQGTSGGLTETFDLGGAHLVALPGLTWIGDDITVDLGDIVNKYVYSNWWQENLSPGTTNMLAGFQAAADTGKHIGAANSAYAISGGPVLMHSSDQVVDGFGSTNINISDGDGFHVWGNTGDFPSRVGFKNITLIYSGTPESYTFADTDVSTAGDAITVTGHGFSAGDAVTITDGSAAIGGLTRGRMYYVGVSGDDLQFYSYSPDTGLSGLQDITGAGSGTYTINRADTGILFNGARHYYTENVFITGFPCNMRAAQEVKSPATGTSGGHYGSHKNIWLQAGHTSFYNSGGANQQEFDGGKMLENKFHFYAGGTVSKYDGTSFEGDDSVDALGYINVSTSFPGARFESAGSGRVEINPALTSTTALMFFGTHWGGGTAPSSWEDAAVADFSANTSQFTIANRRLNFENNTALSELRRDAGNGYPTRKVYNNCLVTTVSTAEVLGADNKAGVSDYTVELQTTNATPTAIWSLNLINKGNRVTALIEASIASKQDGSSVNNYTMHKRTAAVQENGGTVTIINQAADYNQTSSGASYAFAVNGSSIELQATGVAATTINHYATVKITWLAN